MSPRRGLILSVNAGSSSLKISLYRSTSSLSPQSNATSEPVNLLLTSTITDISSPPASFSFTLTAHPVEHASKSKQPVDTIHDHTSAFAHFLNHLNQEASVDHTEIVHVCHRVVHGGDFYEPVVINKATYDHIRKLSDLAPLHNRAALSVIEACVSSLPHANSIAFFDSAFHRTIPPHVSAYPIDQTVARKRGIQKYGFHGLSYAFVLRATAHFLGLPTSNLNLIVLHLGSGASITAIRHGHSIDTTMGLTPASGLPGATRCGDVDPSLLFHYHEVAGTARENVKGNQEEMKEESVGVMEKDAEALMNSECGWKALTGTTDFAEIVRKMSSSDSTKETEKEKEKCEFAFNMLVDRILSFVGAYYVKLDGKVDAIVFAGGIGEKSAELRAAVVERLACLGFRIDGEKNEKVGEREQVVCDVTGQETAETGKRVLVCQTDEQMEMARECALEKKFWNE